MVIDTMVAAAMDQSVLGGTPMLKKLAAVIAFAISVVSAAAAHPGGLNAQGCHNNRKTGDYHCHSAPAPYASTLLGRELSDATPSPSFAYRNCDAARAAGAAPVRRGEPGYGSHLDRDNDGVGCE
jgi:hypothetical protein